MLVLSQKSNEDFRHGIQIWIGQTGRHRRIYYLHKQYYSMDPLS